MVFDQLVERVLSVHRSASNFVLVPFFAAHLWFRIATIMADRPEEPKTIPISVNSGSILLLLTKSQSNIQSHL